MTVTPKTAESSRPFKITNRPYIRACVRRAGASRQSTSVCRVFPPTAESLAVPVLPVLTPHERLKSPRGESATARTKSVEEGRLTRARAHTHAEEVARTRCAARPAAALFSASPWRGHRCISRLAYSRPPAAISPFQISREPPTRLFVFLTPRECTHAALRRRFCPFSIATPSTRVSTFTQDTGSYLRGPGAEMSFRVVRSSKFRHVYGTALKREQCYDNIRVSKSSWDSTFCAVNPKFLAIIVESAGGGAFIVLPHNKVGRISADHPLVGGHKGPVLDIAWCPHNDNVIASGSEDCVVKVWQIPDGGISRTLTDSVVDLQLHQRRVGLVLWHPTALNVLLTAGSDNLVIIWNVGTGEALVRIDCHPDVVYSACWNWDGSRLVTTCKDKKIRIIEPRTGNILEEAVAHEGSKATRAIFLRGGLIFTTGFSKVSERQYSLRAPDMLAEPIVMVELDTSNGVMFPLYDPDTNLVYLCGKGDSVIRYFEITPEPPFVHYINTFQMPDPQRGIGMMPKRGCDVNSCEISRFYRLSNSGFCQVISMTVPRKSELFQEDLYPDTPGDTAAITAEEWEAGQEAEPILISLRDGYQPTASKNDLKVHKKANVLSKGAKVGANSTGGQPAAVISEDIIKEFSEEIRKLKAMIVKHEGRIRVLESAMALQMKEQDRNEKSSSPVDKESLASDEV